MRQLQGRSWSSIHNLGHKPDYVVTDLAIAAIETRRRQEDAIWTGWRERREARIAQDDFN